MDQLIIFSILGTSIALIVLIANYLINKKSPKGYDRELLDVMHSIQNSVETKLQNVQSITNQQLTNMQKTVDFRLQNVANELVKTSETLNFRVDKTTDSLNTRLDKTSEIINNVQKELGSMSEIGRNLSDLQNFFRSPKLRGNIGEQVLKDLLSSNLSNEQYSLQYNFNNGSIVDAIVKIDSGIVPVDSKFPLENFEAMCNAKTEFDKKQYTNEFNKNVKKHIVDISNKYILPDQGTVDFAFMYLPSEAIYYEIVVNSPELNNFAYQNRIIPVSPNTLTTFLRAVMIGYEGKKIEEKAKQILVQLKSIKNETNAYHSQIRTLNRHINNAKNMSDESLKTFESLDNKLNNIQKLENDKANQIEDFQDDLENILRIDGSKSFRK